MGIDFERTITAGRVAAGLFTQRSDRDIGALRDTFSAVAWEELGQKVNVEDDLLSSVMQTIEKRGLRRKKIDYRVPYWESEGRYNPLEVFSALIQFTDFHNQRLPKSVLPPASDVVKYINRVMSSPHPLNISEQFNILLDITDNNAVGAANLGFISSRIMARGYDQRPYPEIVVTPQNLLDWNKKIAKFEVYDKEGKTDGPGDTYYFWTHFFAASAYKALGGMTSGIFQRIFNKGTPLTRFVREHIAGKPIQSPHEEASVLGRNIGLSVAEILPLRQ